MSGRGRSMSDPAVASMLGSIRETIVAASGSSLVGLYLFGSLAAGDFEAGATTVPETRRFVTEMAELARAR